MSAAATCPGFYWIGQSMTTCDMCGAPVWEHDYDMDIDRSPGAGSIFTNRLRPTPFDEGVIGSWLAKGRITAERAIHLLQIGAAAISDNEDPAAGESENR